MPPSPRDDTSPESLDTPQLARAAKLLAGRDPVLAQIHATHGPPPLWPRPATFATLVRIILEQQVSLASAASTYRKLREHCGPNITAARIRKLGEPGLRSIGFSRQKARYAVALADEVHARRFSVSRLRHAHDDEVRSAITARLGLGDWSADVFLLMALRRPDVLPSSDLALVKGIEELDQCSYDNVTALHERTAHWAPYRSVATRMIWQAYLNRRGRQIPS